MDLKIKITNIPEEKLKQFYKYVVETAKEDNVIIPEYVNREVVINYADLEKIEMVECFCDIATAVFTTEATIRFAKNLENEL